MRYFILLVMSFWSLQSLAAYQFMTFKLHELGPHQYEYSSVWNEVTQEATLRIGLVADKIDSAIADKPLSISSAQKAEFVALDVPEMAQDCNQVTHWQFEYTPGLPSYLMYVTLKGPGCGRFASAFDVLQIRFRFIGVPLSHIEPIDVAVDISR